MYADRIEEEKKSGLRSRLGDGSGGGGPVTRSGGRAAETGGLRNRISFKRSGNPRYVRVLRRSVIIGLLLSIRASARRFSSTFV